MLNENTVSEMGLTFWRTPNLCDQPLFNKIKRKMGGYKYATIWQRGERALLLFDAETYDSFRVLVAASYLVGKMPFSIKELPDINQSSLFVGEVRAVELKLTHNRPYCVIRRTDKDIVSLKCFNGEDAELAAWRWSENQFNQENIGNDIAVISLPKKGLDKNTIAPEWIRKI